MTIGLGDKAKDSITGLTGIVVARYEYLNGCIRLALQPAEVKDGKPVDSSVFDIEQVQLIEAAPALKLRAAGGPHEEPSRPSAPAR